MDKNRIGTKLLNTLINTILVRNQFVIVFANMEDVLNQIFVHVKLVGLEIHVVNVFL